MIALAFFALIARAAPEAVLRKEFVFEHAGFRACHASTIAETGSGLIAAWFGGDYEGAKNVNIYVSRRENPGWTKPLRVATGRGIPCWNPVLFQPANGPLLLFYKVGKNSQTWWGMMTTSYDAGRHWTQAQRLPAGILGPIKNKPLQLPDGSLLCGSSVEAGGWRVHMERTADLGQTWTRTPDLNDPAQIYAIQPSLLDLGGGRLRAIGRTRQQRVFALDSADGGQSWGAMSLTDTPNNDSGLDAVRLDDGRYLLAYNDTTVGRTPLSIAVSSDAQTWTPVLNLEAEPGEFSYPAIIQTSDGLVHLTYTWKRQRIRHVVLDPALLRTPRP